MTSTRNTTTFRYYKEGGEPDIPLTPLEPSFPIVPDVDPDDPTDPDDPSDPTESEDEPSSTDDYTDGIPKTGDETNVALYIILMIISISFMPITRKRK